MSDIEKRLAALSPEKRKLFLRRLNQEASTKKSDVQPILSLGRETNSFPLSFSQQRLWLLDQMEPGNPAYNIPGAIRLTGTLNVSALEESLTEIVRRHEALRTTFLIDGEQPIQVIQPPTPVFLPIQDLSTLPEGIGEAEARKMISAEALYRFDLVQGPLFRATLYKLNETEHVFVMILHHIVSDGWSINVLIKEMRALYPGFARGVPSLLPELVVQYVDYAHWQRTMLQGENLEQQLSFWKEQLSGSLPTLRLPVDHPHPEMRTFRGAASSLQLSSSLTEKLKELSQREGSTLFMILMAALNILLHRYSGQDDLIVGSPIANRNRLEVEGLIGYFINMLPLRIDVSGNPTFLELIGRVQKVTLGAYEHQDIPIEKLMEHIRTVRIQDQNPLFQVAFIYQNFPSVDMQLSDLMISPWEIEKQVATLDLSFYMREEDNGLAGIMEYNSDIFKAVTIDRMLAQYRILLEGIVASPRQRILDLPIMLNSANIETSFPLSPIQEGMLFHTLRSAQAGVYIEQIVMDLREAIDADAFVKSWEEIFSRHPVLRTSFEWAGNEHPMQLVHERIELPLEHHDWRSIPTQEQDGSFQAFLEQDRNRGFEMAEPPLMRLALFHVARARYRCIWTFHHAILDGRSFTIILKELFLIYDSLCDHVNWSVASPRPYQEFIRWLQSRSLDDSRNFWESTLAGFTNPNTLSFGFPEENLRGYGEQKIRLPRETTYTLEALTLKYQLTLNTLLQGAWAILLSHYTGENDIVFGTTRSGRHLPFDDANSMVGLFINTLPLRVKITPDMTLTDLLMSVREQSIAMRPHEHTPLHKIQEWSDIPRGSTLFDSILVFENYLLNASLLKQGGKWTQREFKLLEKTHYPLTLAGYADSELLLTVEYDLTRFDHKTINSMMGHLKNLLTSMAEAGLERRLLDLHLLTPQEEHQLLAEWNPTRLKYPPERCVHEFFEDQVKRTPNDIAVATEKKTLTYDDLNQRANQLARYLNKLGAGPGTVVGIYMERSLEMVISLLGVLKAGAAYLPFDPTHSQNRLTFALNDSSSPLLLTQRHILPTLSGFDGRLVHIDTDWSIIAMEETTDPKFDVTDESLAYIIYTSGSTGNPKGVMIEHRALVRFTETASSVYGIGPGDRVLQFASISFDASVEEIYTSLTKGATLVLRDDEMLTSAEHFLRKCGEWNLTVLDLPTAYWHQLTSELSRANVKFPRSLRLTILGGEKAQAPALIEWFHHAPRSIRLVNTYGPTEATVVSTVYEFSPDATSKKVPIGRPMNNVQVYILNQFLHPVPIGVTGELHIGGESLARGYLNQAELTAQKFIPDPFGGKMGARLYKSGDQARYLLDGNIEFMGRRDQQVKIRGFRVELGEIEATLGNHPSIKENVVDVREDLPGDKYLVVYFVPIPDEAININELRSYLKEKLPEYMVPAAYVEIKKIPLTSSGKLDRRALPAPDRSHSGLQGQFAKPRDDVEEVVANIFETLLNSGLVGIYDSFFDLGGHSLLATRLLSRINERFAVHVSLRDFFMAPTVVGVSESIKTIRWATRNEPGTSEHFSGDREEMEI